MTIERRVQTIPTTGRAELPRGNFLLLLTASASVDIRAEREGFSEGFNGIVGGLYARRVVPWNAVEIIGAAGTSLEYLYGSENVTEDETDIRLGVSAVAGTVSTAERPSDTIVENAPVVASNPSAPAADVAVLIAANASRRRLRVYADATNPGSCFVMNALAGEFIAELQPGTSQAFDTLQGLWISNANGADCTFYLCEEE